MTNPASKYVTILDREIHYMEWGAVENPKLVLWHGLARTGRDFDDLASALADRWHIAVPDTIGRGLSQWSPKPEVEYSLDFYAKLATAFVDALGWKTVDWVGTSMGGAIAMRAGAGPLAGRIRRLVLNDIGPEINPAAIERIRSYAGKPPRFERVSELEAYFRQVYLPYGYLSDAQWRRLAETSTRRLPDGGITPHYDPNMIMQITHHPQDDGQWDDWKKLDCAMLCLRGENSDLLLPETAARMPKENPRCRVVEVRGCGHAPALNVPEQIALVENFLAG
ncbi:MAG: alpha/beta fold hydrolase [Rhodoblastus sp.]